MFTQRNGEAAPIIQGAAWFGSEPPTLEAVERANPLEVTNPEPRPVLNILMDRADRLPSRYVVVGISRKLKPASPNYGGSWELIEHDLLRAWAERKGKDPWAIAGKELDRRDATKARSKGIDPKLARLKDDVNDALGMWRRGEYDNLKDAILDARRLLPKARKQLSSHVPKLESMLNRARTQLERLARKDPKIAAYAKGLLSKR
jgi:hypothetical protein